MTKTELEAENERLKKELEENYKYSTQVVELNAHLKAELRCYEYYFEHREKVVHCKDCIHNGLNTCPIAFTENQTLQFVNHDPDFWCAKGELHREENIK